VLTREESIKACRVNWSGKERRRYGKDPDLRTERECKLLMKKNAIDNDDECTALVVKSGHQSSGGCRGDSLYLWAPGSRSLGNRGDPGSALCLVSDTNLGFLLLFRSGRLVCEGTDHELVI
jgi:hypothetical protein